MAPRVSSTCYVNRRFAVVGLAKREQLNIRLTTAKPDAFRSPQKYCSALEWESSDDIRVSAALRLERQPEPTAAKGKLGRPQRTTHRGPDDTSLAAAA